VILPVLFVYALTRLFWWITSAPWLLNTPGWTEGAIKTALWVPPSIVLVMVLRRVSWREALAELGLTTLAWPGVRLAIAATVPMVAIATTSFGFRFHLDSQLSVVLLGPFAEEVLYRGFLFQQLWRRARWPMWAAALGSALVFAIAHHKDLDELLALGVLKNDLTTPLLVIGPPILATIAGGCLFAWLTWRWQSLWPAIALHAAINFWWDIASGGTDPVIAAASQGIALTLVVALTLRQTSGRGVSSRPASPPAR
jgi:membrane protease YdiL (CAAX protease family)